MSSRPAERPFTEEEVLRYSRHIILPNIGAAGQRKLLDAKVLCVGAGGLGSPVAMYLAAAGVGTLGILDFDRVDLTNLQRQLLHDTDDVGRPKVDSAADRITGINPGVNVIKHDTVLNSENAFEVLEPYDIGIDESLIGKLLLFDALDMEFTTVKLRWDPDCPVCGKNPTVTELIDYDMFCGLPFGQPPLEAEHGVATTSVEA